MKIERAIEIIQKLADGIDPHTGKSFMTPNPYQHPDVIRALHIANEHLVSKSIKPSKNEFINFFLNTKEIYKPTSSEISKANSTSGVYAWYSDLTLIEGSKPGVPSQGPWRIDNFLLLYIGSVTKRPIKKRLYYHAGGGRADQSLVQLRLGCLLSQTLNIRLQKGNKSGFFDFVPKERLRNWIKNHTHFKWLASEEAEHLEKMLITELKPLLNKSDNESHPFYLPMKNAEKFHLERSNHAFLAPS